MALSSAPDPDPSYDANSFQLNRQSWDKHYQRQRSRQGYPDENLVRLLGACPRGSALDLGCGSGRHLKLLAEQGFDPLYGLDSSPQAIEISRALCPQAHCSVLNLEEHPGKLDIGALTEATGLSMIVAWGVLHYNNESMRHKLLAAIRDALTKEEGVFVGTLRSNRDSHYQNNPDINQAPIYFFDQQECQSLLESYFSEVEMGYMERSPIGQLDKRVCHWFFRCSNRLRKN